MTREEKNEEFDVFFFLLRFRYVLDVFLEIGVITVFFFYGARRLDFLLGYII